MHTKLDLLHINEPLFNLDFYIIVETNLNCNFFSGELRFSSFNIYKCDRDYINCDVTRDSIILICINKRDVSKQIDISVSSINFEQIFVHVKIGNKEIIIVVVYFPLNSDVSTYDSFLHSLNIISLDYLHCAVIICGDFNPKKF